MSRAVFLVCLLSILMLVPTSLAQGLGVNWGSMGSHSLPPKNVVQMLKDNGIKKVKLFDAEPDTMDALAGSGMQVMVGIPNEKLEKLADSYKEAQEWVKQNVTKYLRDGGVNIRYVAVGNEPYLTSYNGTYVKTTYPALKNIQKALDEAGSGGKVKATVPFNADVYESPSNKPSDGRFRKDIKNNIVEILRVLNDNRTPFVVNIYPFLSLYQSSDFPKEFAFFEGGSEPVKDNNIEYKNVFDANCDTLISALKKVGFGNLDIIIGEVGWPTDGDKNANGKLAKKFYDGLLKKLATEDGTPLRKKKLEVYLFGLFDENQKSIAPGDFERHWGIFRYDGQPKFTMDLSGKGQGNNLLKGVQGVQYLDQQWCVLKSDVRNLSNTQPEVGYACSMSDCTSLGVGRSCDLDQHGNVSYAFNAYFQNKDQDVRACDFNGMANIVKQNASMGDCLFPIQILNAGVRPELSIFAGLFLILMSFFTLM
ncbi:PREDICTED: glucan endo-1,3-beta-glucosidase 8-like [Prunus mume]|uniref:glucan endo-1,3-beta-D-glucosidase n=1 Tax=Prunus mume TaxID=102107 RepID=A0ABM0NZY3_PRUMU|nr:PREDICTED: glucan endo-1,3-beta-glucosidase 8-like [Prunus mume]